MKLKILSTIAAISATATSAASLTCGDVQTLYQDDGCCTAAGQTCLKSLSIAAGSTSELNLSNTGELSLDLTSFSNQKLDTSVLDASAVTGGDGVTFAKVLKYTRFDGGVQLNSAANFNGDFLVKDASNNPIVKITQNDASYGLVSDKNVLLRQGSDGKSLRMLDGQADFEASTTVNFNGDVNFANPLKTGAYIPASTACTNSGATHGFISEWKTGYSPNGGWEMQLQGGHHTTFPDAACQVRELTIWDTGIYSTGASTMGALNVNSVPVTSDSRIKKDIVDADIEDALQKVLDIELKEYGYTDPKQEGEKTVGFIAQQVKEVYPDAIAISDREEPIWNEAGERVEISDLHRIKKDKIFALHHGALQYLDAKIATLEARLAALEA